MAGLPFTYFFFLFCNFLRVSVAFIALWNKSIREVTSHQASKDIARLKERFMAVFTRENQMNPVHLFTPTIRFRLKLLREPCSFVQPMFFPQREKGQVYHPIIHVKQEAVLCCVIAGLFWDAVNCVASDGRVTNGSGRMWNEAPPAVDGRDWERLRRTSGWLMCQSRFEPSISSALL
jgi:hypothetical protein